MSVLSPKYRCCKCWSVYDNEEDAVECFIEDVEPEVDEFYACPICDDTHTTEASAVDCCGYDPFVVLPPTAAELEAAGQLRLLP